jgi:hypothetical protein
MANKRQGYLDKAKRLQQRKSTNMGAFTEYCGGRITDDCIDRALNSNNESLRASAQTAKNVRARNGGESGRVLPGGIMKPIGYGAFKFEGNKHDEAGRGSDSGIILEESTKAKQGLEVEDGELQVDVNTKQGKKEYIVSDYIKNPATGNTLAEDLERELSKAKNNQEAAKVTARYVRLNEKLNGKNPERIKGQDGAMIDYGPSGDFIPVDPDDPDVKLNTAGAQALDWIDEQHRTEDGLYKRTGEEDPDVAALIANNPWFDWKNFDPAKPADVKKFQEAYNEKAPEGKKIKVDGKLGEQTASAYIPYQAEKQEVAERPEDPSEWDINIDEEEEEETPAPAEEAPAEEAPAAEEGPAPKFRPRMTGNMFQAAGPLAQLFRKKRVAEQVQPSTIKSPRLGRVNMDQQRAALRENTQATKDAATRGMGAGSAFVAQQAAAAQEDAAQRQIDSQETAANVGIANQEKGLDLEAQKFNAAGQMQSDQMNAAQNTQLGLMNDFQDMAAIDKLGSLASQQVRDVNQQFANYGSDLMNYGAPAADFYANVYKGNMPGVFGTRDIKVVNDGSQAVEEAFAKDLKEPEGEDVARKGRYTKKVNKVRRKKRRR